MAAREGALLEVWCATQRVWPARSTQCRAQLHKHVRLLFTQDRQAVLHVTGSKLHEHNKHMSIRNITFCRNVFDASTSGVTMQDVHSSVELFGALAVFM